MDIKEHAQFLLKEYQLCQEHTKHLDRNIWATSGFIGLASIGSLLFSNHTESLLSITMIGLLVVPTVWIWWKMANRWWDIQHAIFKRMKHIEEVINFYQTRYLDFLDNPIAKRKRGVLEGLPDGQFEELRTFSPNFYKGKVRSPLRMLPWLITIIWLLYVAIKIIISQKESLMEVIGTISLTHLGLVIILGSVFIGGLGIGLIIGCFIYKSKSKTA